MDFENGSVKLKTCENTLWAHISGEIDHQSARIIREAIDTSLTSLSPDALILELSGITFMDSSGLGLILGRYTQMVQLGGTFKLKDPTPEITKILVLAGVDRLIPTETSLNQQ